MAVMYLSEPAAFDDVLAVLAELEHRINGTLRIARLTRVIRAPR